MKEFYNFFWSKKIFFLSLAILTIGSFCVWIADSQGIYNGMGATDILGNYSEDGEGNLIPDFIHNGANNGPSNLGFDGPHDATIDSINHRLFVADTLNNRVLVYNLDSNNELLDYEADYVLGQPDFESNDTIVVSSSTLDTPWSVEYDSTNNYLFVSDLGRDRVMVYDVTSITNGENAVYVLGQSTFTASGGATTQSRMNDPLGMAYDPLNSRLFVTQFAANRVTVYDFSTTTISNGKNALYVLGQTTFTGAGAANTQAGMNGPRDVVYVTSTSRLYVVQSGNNRVTVYDFSTTTISNGKNALYVLGQTTFTGAGAANTQAGMSSPYGLAYDTEAHRLFVAQTNNSRVTVYDMVTTTNGENAVNVLGQSNYTGSGSTTTQSGLFSPRAVAYDTFSDNLFVVDYGNNRLVKFNASTSSISNGMNSVDVIGQFIEDGFGGLMSISTKKGRNNGPNNVGFDTTYDVELDDTNHRLFVADTSNNRVLVYNLDSNNELIDYEADYVLGQPDFNSNTINLTQSGMSSPRSLAYSSSTNRLYVAEAGFHRVTVYDVASITNGENAINVLGQGNFTSAGSVTTQSGMHTPVALALDPTSSTLYVAQSGNHRVTVYDVASITNGENAINVLGQGNFTSGGAITIQSGMNTPTDLAIRFNTTTPLLYVAQSGNHRVTVYDVSSITNGENAINVLGQVNFSNSFQANSQTGMSSPSGLAYDQVLNRLFVAQSGNNRVTVYDVATTTDGEAAIFVLGQSSFVVNTAATTQSGMRSPSGLAHDPGNNYLYVAEYNNHRVTKFDLTTLPDVPTVPSVVSFTRQSTSLTATWGAVSGHGILYTVSSTATSTMITTSSVSVVFSNLVPNTTYSFQVKAVDQFGQDSGYSSVTSSITTNLSTPTFSAFNTFSTSSIMFTWSTVSGATGYYVSSTVSSSLITAMSTNYTFENLTPSSTYYFQIQAFDSYGSLSSFSSLITGRTYKLSDFLFQQKITGGDVSPGSDAFGYSVGLLGDHIMVGSVSNDGPTGATSSVGAVFAFDNTEWGERDESPLRGLDALSADDSFGESVSIATDGNGNTYALIGMDGDDDRGSAAGAAYVFKLVDDTWVEQDKLTASDGAASDFFGREVSLAADTNGNMYALIGAEGDDDMGSAAGAAYVFKLVDDAWVEQDKLTASDGGGGDALGISVHIVLGNNSSLYALIGATGDDDRGFAAGAAYVFKLVDDTWVEQDKLTASDGGGDDEFGENLSLAFDGRNNVYALIGATGDDDMGNGAGAAYVFRLDEDTWVEESKIHAFDGAASDAFGDSVALALGPDNQTLYAAVGATGDDDLASGAGAVYVYRASSFPRTPRNITSTALGQRAVLVSWDTNNNSTSTVYEVVNATGQVIGTTTSTRYLVTGLSANSSHQFRVRAQNALNTSEVTPYTSTSSFISTDDIVDTVTMSMPPQIGSVDFQFRSRSHVHAVTVDTIVGGIATITIQSDPVTISLAAGQSQNIDTDGNGKNDTTVTMNSVSESDANFTLSYLAEGSGGGVPLLPTNPPILLDGVKSLLINKDVASTKTREVILTIAASNVVEMAVSNDVTFNNIPFEPYVGEKKWKLDSGDGVKTVFVKLRSPAGDTIIVSDTITLENQATDGSVTKSCPLIPGNAYKSPYASSVFYITEECTKRPFKNPEMFFTYFTSWDAVSVVSITALSVVPLDQASFMYKGPLYRPTYGALIKTPYDPKVYVLIDDTKYWITDETVFSKLGYRSDWIEDVDPRLLDAYQVGEEITRTDIHPAFTLIKYANSPKVYRLEKKSGNADELVKRWVTSEEAFKKLKFRGDRIIVIRQSEVYEDGEDLK